VNPLNLKKFSVLLSLSLILIGVLSYFSILEGSVKLTNENLKDYIFDGSTGNAGIDSMIKNLRMTRIVGSILVGSAIAVSGLLMQGYFRNPLADPYFMGIASGASLGVVLYTFTSVLFDLGIPHSVYGRIIAAYAGSLIAMFVVINISKVVKQISTLLICGMMISAAISGFSDILVATGSYVDGENSELAGYLSWGMGSISSLTWVQLESMAFLIIPFIILTYLFLSKNLDANLLGENYAVSVGVDTKKFRRLLVLLSCILSSTVVAFAGPIAFVGIVCPIVARLLCGTSKHFFVLPMTALTGIIFVILADILSRPGVLFQATVPLPLLCPLSLLGGPIVIISFLKSKKMRI
jgi:iron complex transport system permease protein